jgi:hypothetical protein
MFNCMSRSSYSMKNQVWQKYVTVTHNVIVYVLQYYVKPVHAGTYRA